MPFLIDKQTLDDLNVFGKRGRDSIYSMFNVTSTRGGGRQLEEMFRSPLCDADEINSRSSIISFFCEEEIVFPFGGKLFDILDHYLGNTDGRTKILVEGNTLEHKLKRAIGATTEFDQLQQGVMAAVEVVSLLREFLSEIAAKVENSPYREQFDELSAQSDDPDFAPLLAERRGKKPSYENTASLDTYIRFKINNKVQRLLYSICTLDVYISVAAVARSHGFAFARALPGGSNSMKIREMYHPQVPNAVSNSLDVDRDSNVIFLTGANMAGKSTFMKTLSITVYLAHLGFPIPAEAMEFSVLDGMYTTINLPDNLNIGYSHFYAEVMRVKKVAEQLGRSLNLLVIFDELFRGTNVKDAYDATVVITEAFSSKRDCLFVISTHIIEAGETLGKIADNIKFLYLPTEMRGSVAHYPYKLAEGITEDRHGMMIINNEHVLEIIRSRDRQKSVAAPSAKPPFLVDKQTLGDLNMLGEYRPNTIFNLFNRTHTRAAKQLLEEMFAQPLNDAGKINERVSLFKYLQGLDLDFPVDNELFRTVEHYFVTFSSRNLPFSYVQSGYRLLLQRFGFEKEYKMMHEGLLSAIRFMRLLREFILKVAEGEVPSFYRPYIAKAVELLENRRLRWLFDISGSSGSNSSDTLHVPWIKFARYDYILRTEFREELKDFMRIVYELDAFIAVTDTARERGFAYAKALPFEEDKNHLTITEVYHPCIPNAVSNTIVMDHEKNVVFLTGANMAGKSTLMKSFSIAVYLAHMGFPVAAESMEFTVQDGLFTSINVSDNLNIGYSHFYAEVMRVKNVAEEVAAGKNLVIVFDELFKGTNVKDAYDATVAVTEAFGENRNCLFVISTHIIEAGHTLRESHDNLRFVFVPTVMEDGVPRYPYKLREGITDDRHGMVIINNERIVEIIKNN